MNQYDNAIPNTDTTITFLGTGDSMGVPRLYCDCPVCAEARKEGLNKRLRSSLLLRCGGEELVIDCGPDWTRQMEQAGIREVGRLLITHAHFDHIGGLPELADVCRWTGRKTDVFAPQEVLDTIVLQFPWISRHLNLYPNDAGCCFGEWLITPFRVCHGKNGFSYAYRFSIPNAGRDWVYCPDSINLQEKEKQHMRKLALLILGTSYYHEHAEFATRSVYDMVEAQELLADLNPTETWFTHMSHGVDRREMYPLSAAIRLAQEGVAISV